ncbi:hypothetical protein F7734_58040 [Scytonema sp. UIC 10036]|uniref:hypothetical protein n=1 Tax=Scytonema sp. UIC 10036 TaxID=2304196 RepID=UPI0012DAC6A9|nr:hypothetical protein [Scytonema sp. UIC 10036]MUH01463.1 hypothetical protein [Scytonema sp. UIC 10036]
MNTLMTNLINLVEVIVGKIIKIPERILLACSGVSLDILNNNDSQCHVYKGIYMRLGGIILIISTFAAVSSGYAVFTVLEAGSIKEISLEPEREQKILSIKDEISSLKIQNKEIEIQIEKQKKTIRLLIS